MKFRLNSMEKKWILYDVGNSAFTLLVSTIMPIYFNYLADQAGISEVNYLAYWGYATSAATIPGFSSRRSHRLRISWFYTVLAVVYPLICDRQIRLLPESGSLRFHASGYHHGRAL